jgi:hypothetical protein
MKIFPDAKAALFCPGDASYEDALASLKVIEMDLRHRITLRKKEMQNQDV